MFTRKNRLSVIRYFKPFAVSIAAVVLLTFFQTITDLSLPDYLAELVDKGIAAKDTPLILHLGGIMLLIAFAGVICAIYAGYLASKAALGVGRDIRSSLFRKITALSFSDLGHFGTASLITRTTNDIQQIQNTIFMMLRMMLRAPLMCVGGIIMAIRKDVGLSLVLFSALPVVLLVLFLVLHTVIPMYRKLQKQLDRLNLVLRENLTGMRIVRAFSRVGYEKRRFAGANRRYTGTALRINRLMAVLDPTMSIMMNGLTIAILWVASFRIDRGELMIGDMLAFIQYAMIIFMSFLMLSMLFVLLPRAFASWERVRAVLQTPVTVADPPSPSNISGGKGILAFNRVSFRYEGADTPALCDISFTASPGETIAIIGGTGSGKSTLVNLILRYYDIEKGRIMIDGADITQMPLHNLRERIGYVPQKSVLFAGTIEENMRFGKQDATQEEIDRACRIAQAGEFINALPNGYHSHVAQGGANFSGGQKQRLSIARAIVKNPEIYIFDDCFSALDMKTDALLQAALRNEVGHATKIIVAQRVTSIMGADHIIVMDNGRILDTGTHEELMGKSDIYREIVRSQLNDQQM